MPDAPELLVVGSVALDTRDGPFGKVKEELGGSAVYFALAASLLVPVKVIAPIARPSDISIRLWPWMAPSLPMPKAAGA